MTGHVVTVPPSAIAKSAMFLMKGHEIGALPVVHDQSTLMGIVYLQDLLGRDPMINVSDLMTKNFATVGPDTTVFDAAEMMTKTGHSHLVVVDDGQLVGIMSHTDALKELGTSFDPLTGLPWSDALRDWATSALKNGHEIAVIFIDLNQFGLFNKNYGHITGDAVLKATAEVLKSGMEPESDFLCRYGGDEFAIATVRHADDAVELADRLMGRIALIEIADVPEGVSGTYGIAGGRRTKERLDVHYAATLDDLINRASQNCMKNKPGRAELEAVQPEAAAPEVAAGPPVAGPGRLKIERINFASSDLEVTVDVSLVRGDQQFQRSVSGYAVATRNVLRLVAEAAAAAVSSSLASGHGVVVDDVLIQSTGSDNDVVTVVAVFITPSASVTHAGSAIVRRADLYRAAASALLSAVNRFVQRTPGAAE